MCQKNTILKVDEKFFESEYISKEATDNTRRKT